MNKFTRNTGMFHVAIVYYSRQYT